MIVGFFDQLFGNDAGFLGFMDFMGELDDAPAGDEDEVTFTIEFEDDEDDEHTPPKKKK